MILFSQTRIVRSAPRPVASGFIVNAEGLALVADYTGSEFGVKPSTGAATDVFVGVSFDQQTPIVFLPLLQRLIVNGANQVNLSFVPQAGTIRVAYADSNMPLTPAVGAPAAGEFQLVGQLVNVNAADAGKTLLVTYEYAPTVAQSIAIQGNIIPGGPAGQYLGQTGVIELGDVYTSSWDTTADWYGATIDLRIAANGMFTNGGTGVKVPGYVTSVPSETSPWLGFSLV